MKERVRLHQARPIHNSRDHRGLGWRKELADHGEQEAHRIQQHQGGAEHGVAEDDDRAREVGRNKYGAFVPAIHVHAGRDAECTEGTITDRIVIPSCVVEWVVSSTITNRAYQIAF